MAARLFRLRRRKVKCTLYSRGGCHVQWVRVIEKGQRKRKLVTRQGSIYKQVCEPPAMSVFPTVRSSRFGLCSINYAPWVPTEHSTETRGRDGAWSNGRAAAFTIRKSEMIIGLVDKLTSWANLPSGFCVAWSTLTSHVRAFLDD